MDEPNPLPTAEPVQPPPQGVKLEGELFDKLGGAVVPDPVLSPAEKRRLTMTDKKFIQGEGVEVPTIDADGLHDEIVGGLEGLQGSTPAPDSQPTQAASAPTPETDARGERFNPSIHATTDDGKPKINSDGTFRKKWTPRDKREPDEFDAFADIVCEMTYQGMGMIFDSEEAIPTKERGDKLKEAWATYARIKNLSIADPLWALVAQNGIYIQSVVSKPKSKAKALSYGQKIIGWFKKKEVTNAT